MNHQRKFIILIGTISLFLILNSGCIFVTPDYDSYTVSYIRVNPSVVTMQVNTSKIFKVWAYDSEDNSIPIDPSKVTWDWNACFVCGASAELNPKSGSLKTTFTPYSTGTYKVYAYYKGKNDYSPITVTK